MGEKKKYIEMFGSLTEPFNSILYIINEAILCFAYKFNWSTDTAVGVAWFYSTQSTRDRFMWRDTVLKFVGLDLSSYFYVAYIVSDLSCIWQLLLNEYWLTDWLL